MIVGDAFAVACQEQSIRDCNRIEAWTPMDEIDRLMDEIVQDAYRRKPWLKTCHRCFSAAGDCGAHERPST